MTRDAAYKAVEEALYLAEMQRRKDATDELIRLLSGALKDSAQVSTIAMNIRSLEKLSRRLQRQIDEAMAPEPPQ